MEVTERSEALRKDKEFIFAKLGYKPSPEQWEIHLDPHRIRLVAGGERGGKSRVGAMDLLGSIAADGGGGGSELYWLYGADYGETSQEYFYLVDALTQLNIKKDASKNYNPGEIILSPPFKAVIKTVSGTDPTKIGREAPDGILVCEAAKIDYITYFRLQARLSEKRAWMLMTGTFEGSLGWYPELFQQGQIATDEFRSFSLPTWSNLAIFPGGRDDPEIKRQEAALPRELFDERFGGIPCPPMGLVFKEFRVTHHVKELDIVPDQPIYLWTDPGFAGAYAVEFVQIINDVVCVVDEVYEQGLTTQEIIQVCQQKPYWKHVSPRGVVDIAALQHQAMPAVAEVWLQEAGIHLSSNKVGIQEGIDRYRTFLKVNPLTNQPSILYDPKCKGVISEHGGCPNPFTEQQAVYRYKVGKEGEVVGEKPEDKNNHGIKTVIYGLVDRFGYAKRSERRVLKVRSFGSGN